MIQRHTTFLVMENESDNTLSSLFHDESQPDNIPQVNSVTVAITTTTTRSHAARAVRTAVPVPAPAIAISPARTRRKEGERTVGAGAYHLTDNMNFLEIIENVLPIVPDQWAEVASQH